MNRCEHILGASIDKLQGLASHPLAPLMTTMVMVLFMEMASTSLGLGEPTPCTPDYDTYVYIYIYVYVRAPLGPCGAL